MKITIDFNSYHTDSSAVIFKDNELIFRIEEMVAINEMINKIEEITEKKFKKKYL
tara:strand:- start:120 stop:284 length:165 start_codon:yes stop_codon:yes gene_type:complete